MSWVTVCWSIPGGPWCQHRDLPPSTPLWQSSAVIPCCSSHLNSFSRCTSPALALPQRKVKKSWCLGGCLSGSPQAGMRFLESCYAGSCWLQEGETLILRCSVHSHMSSFIPRQCYVWSVTWGMCVSIRLFQVPTVSYTPLSHILVLHCLATDFFPCWPLPICMPHFTSGLKQPGLEGFWDLAGSARCLLR